VARAIERHRLISENRRLAQAERHRLHQEHNEAQRLLDQQRQLVLDLELLKKTALHNRPLAFDDQPLAPLDLELGSTLLSLPDQLVGHYRELLRAYVIMGSGNLGREMAMLAELLVSAGVSARQTMQLHLQVLEDLLQGLGTRSTRHVMTRADLLVLEVMVNLAEGYRKMYHERVAPPRQQLLPGFDPQAAAR
jgi:hypothetical protein